MIHTEFIQIHVRFRYSDVFLLFDFFIYVDLCDRRCLWKTLKLQREPLSLGAHASIAAGGAALPARSQGSVPSLSGGSPLRAPLSCRAQREAWPLTPRRGSSSDEPRKEFKSLHSISSGTGRGTQSVHKTLNSFRSSIHSLSSSSKGFNRKRHVHVYPCIQKPHSIYSNMCWQKVL